MAKTKGVGERTGGHSNADCLATAAGGHGFTHMELYISGHGAEGGENTSSDRRTRMKGYIDRQIVSIRISGHRKICPLGHQRGNEEAFTPLKKEGRETRHHHQTQQRESRRPSQTCK